MVDLDLIVIIIVIALIAAWDVVIYRQHKQRDDELDAFYAEQRRVWAVGRSTDTVVPDNCTGMVWDGENFTFLTNIEEA